MKLLLSIVLALFTTTAMADYAGEWDQATVLEKIKEGKTLILDVRSASEYADGHVPSAINIPHNELEANLAKLKGYENKDIVIYCRSGRRAGVAEGILSGKGFTQLYHLEGDMNGWNEAKLTQEK